LEEVADAGEELGGLGAVEDAVVAAEGDVHLVARGDFVVVDDGCCWRVPTARIAACGGLMTAVKLVIAYMPRFETVKVAPESSGG